MRPASHDAAVRSVNTATSFGIGSEGSGSGSIFASNWYATTTADVTGCPPLVSFSSSMRRRAAATSGSQLAVRSAVSTTATTDLSGSSLSSSSARRRASSSRDSLFATYPILGVVSMTMTTATGWSPWMLNRSLLKVGWYRVRQNRAMRSMRRARRMKCRRRSLRWLVLSFCLRNRNAGKVSRFGSCFMMRCRRIGSPTSAAPAIRMAFMVVL